MDQQLPQKLHAGLGRFSPTEQAMVSRAYLFAKQKHSGQKRKSGSPYISHPLRLAVRIAGDNYDPATIAAALLHDTLEDTATTYDELVRHFGQEIASLVDGVTKVSAIRTKSKALSNEQLFLSQVDNYRKIILATAADIRVMIVRLYDRLDNVNSLRWILPGKQQFYARETIEIYAPIAERLGMGVVKGELEDMAFPYAYTEEYRRFMKVARPAYKNPTKIINEAIPVIKKTLIETGIAPVSIAGRAKHYYSLYSKLKEGRDIKNVFDISALRIIVDSVENCYRALGLVHSLFQPLPGQIDDYIARPKESGYQSLHTKVGNESGEIFEIQIRTTEMHEVAEYGPAAHWHYKDGVVEKNLRLAEKSRQEWLAELEKIRKIRDKKDFIRQIKEEFFSRQVFVFTPKGKIIKLPVDSCGLDFAYQIHSQLGNTCTGVKINDRLVPISTKLKTGNIVEIITSARTVPSHDWLKIVKTSSAKHHIRNQLRQKYYTRYLADGEKSLLELILKNRLGPLDRNLAVKKIADSKLPYNDLESALAAIGEGCLQRFRLLKILYPDFDNSSKRKEGAKLNPARTLLSLKNIRHLFANCCQPKITDRQIIGYLSSQHIIKIHRTNCKRIASVDQRRLIDIYG